MLLAIDERWDATVGIDLQKGLVAAKGPLKGSEMSEKKVEQRCLSAIVVIVIFYIYCIYICLVIHIIL